MNKTRRKLAKEIGRLLPSGNILDDLLQDFSTINDEQCIAANEHNDVGNSEWGWFVTFKDKNDDIPTYRDSDDNSNNKVIHQYFKAETKHAFHSRNRLGRNNTTTTTLTAVEDEEMISTTTFKNERTSSSFNLRLISFDN